MISSNLGYACICMALSNQTPKITTNRSMVKKTFLQKGLKYASQLGLQNSKDLIEILKWNVKNNIFLFRISSEFFPWASEYNIEDLPDFPAISHWLKKAGDYAKTHNIRLTAHPGPFVVLTSPKENVIKNSIVDLEIHGKIFDLIGLDRSPYNKINIHCNGVYGDKISAMNRFCENFKKLSPSVKSRLTIENDDKASMYSVKDLMYIHNKIGIPITFDFHHFLFNTGDQSEEESLKLAISTWPEGVKPVVHYSESKSVHESNPKIRLQAHSEYVFGLPNTYGCDVDIMIECKQKEQALIKLREMHE